MSQQQADKRVGHSTQQKPAVFCLSIRPTSQKPRKRTHVKRIARSATWLDMRARRGILALA